ncbi:MAG: hypothetical protein H6983_26620 [Ectothiorhodospiraceae bacterium]|nr:hypothetical protein [Ectothiorhodospiraceae bacterium]
MGRTSERAPLYTDAQRIALLEKDHDETDDTFDGVRAEIAGVRAEMAALRQVLVGILVAVTTASILLAVNLVVKA